MYKRWKKKDGTFSSVTSWSIFVRSSSLGLVLLSSIFGMFTFIAPAVATPLIGYTVSGTVFNDSNANGIQDITPTSSPPRDELGIAGVTVTAYNIFNAIIGTPVTTDAKGKYTLPIAMGGPARIQFSGFGAETTDPVLKFFQPSTHFVNGSTEGTTVEFVNGTSTVNLGLVRPDQYCQDNPNVAISCYLFGNTQTGPNASKDVLVRFPYNASDKIPAPSPISTNAQIGSVWGMAYRSSTDSLFVSSYIKRHTGLGASGNPGSIYLISGARSGPLSTSTLFTTLAAGTNPHTDPTYLSDANTFNQVGKVGIGDLALSEDGSTLYAVNLANRSLESIAVGTSPAPPIAGTPVETTIPIPADCPGTSAGRSDLEPFAVTAHNGLVYVGAVCSAESTVSGTSPLGNAAAMHAYVFTFIPGVGFNSVDAPVLEFPLNYPRTCANEANQYPACAATGVANLNVSEPAPWNPWHPGYIRYRDNGGKNNAVVYPQPELTNIVFDNNNAMILGLRDRFGDQMGVSTNPPPGSPFSNDGQVSGVAAGQTLRACLNNVGAYVLEANGSCGGITTAGSAAPFIGQGPGTPGGKYYFEDRFLPYHDYVSLGSLLQVVGLGTVMSAVFDPITGGSFNTGGVRTWVNADGSDQNQYHIYAASGGFGGNPPGATFGKANGLGGMVALCQSAPIEVGNRVWIDSNGNGIQDANEPAVPGVTVHLYDTNGNLVATTKTDSNGDYYFTIQPYTSYTVKLDNPADYATGGPLAGYQLTGAVQGNDRSIDSNGTLPQPGLPIGTGNFPQAPIGSHSPGQNDHTFDFGFTQPPDMGIMKLNAGGNSFEVGQNVRYTLVAINSTSAGPVVSPNTITVTDFIPAGFSRLVANGGPNWNIMLASNSSPTTLTATYIGPYPIGAGEVLPIITIEGRLTRDARRIVTNAATVVTPYDSNPNNNTTTNTISVHRQNNHLHQQDNSNHNNRR